VKKLIGSKVDRNVTESVSNRSFREVIYRLLQGSGS